MNPSSRWFIIIGIIVMAAGAIGFWMYQESKPGPLDDFAKCLKNKGLVFYGAFWCPHCQDQKKMFGKSAKHLPYTECSTPDSNGQLQVCRDANVLAYPTWKLADGTLKEGELSLQELAEKSTCSLPSNF